MLDILESKGIYRKSFCCFFGGSDPNRLSQVPDGTYDAIVIAGGFSKEHLPVDSLREIARLLKKGSPSMTRPNI